MKQRAPIYRQIWELFRQDGHIRPGTGMISGVIALFLAILAVLGVLAFHFPAYLTTPELRAFYSVDAMRALLFGALAGTIALANIVLGRQRWLNIAAFALVCGAVAAGGAQVVVTTSTPATIPTWAWTGSSWTCWPPAPSSSSSSSTSPPSPVCGAVAAGGARSW